MIGLIDEKQPPRGYIYMGLMTKLD
jgi:hypothetical protein